LAAVKVVVPGPAMVGPKPVPLTTPFTMMSPPPAVVVKVLLALRARARLMVCKLVLLFVTLPPSVIALPFRTNAPAVELNIRAANEVFAVILLFVVRLVVPAKATVSAATGIVDVQLPTVLQFESAPPPFHVVVTPMMECATERSAKMMNVGVVQPSRLRSLI